MEIDPQIIMFIIWLVILLIWFESKDVINSMGLAILYSVYTIFFITTAIPLLELEYAIVYLFFSASIPFVLGISIDGIKNKEK